LKNKNIFILNFALYS